MIKEVCTSVIKDIVNIQNFDIFLVLPILTGKVSVEIKNKRHNQAKSKIQRLLQAQQVNLLAHFALKIEIPEYLCRFTKTNATKC